MRNGQAGYLFDRRCGIEVRNRLHEAIVLRGGNRETGDETPQDLRIPREVPHQLTAIVLLGEAPTVAQGDRETRRKAISADRADDLDSRLQRGDAGGLLGVHRRPGIPGMLDVRFEHRIVAVREGVGENEVGSAEAAPVGGGWLRKSGRRVQGLEIVHFERRRFDVIGRERVLRHHFARQPDHGLVEPGRRIDLELDVQDLPTVPQTGDDASKVRLQRPVERIAQITSVVSGKGVVEAAFALEGGERAFEVLRGQGRRPDAVTCRLPLGKVRVARPRSLALDQPARKPGRKRDRVTGAFDVQPHQPGGRGGAAENAVHGTGAKTARRRRRNEIARTPALDLIAGDERGQELASAPALSFGHGDSGRHDENAGMGEHVVRVALIPHRDRHRIGEYRAHAGGSRSIDPHRGPLAGPHSRQPEALRAQDGPARVDGGYGLGGCHCDGDCMVHESLRLVDHGGRQVFEFQVRNELPEPRCQRRF